MDFALARELTAVDNKKKRPAREMDEQQSAREEAGRVLLDCPNLRAKASGPFVEETLGKMERQLKLTGSPRGRRKLTAEIAIIKAFRDKTVDESVLNGRVIYEDGKFLDLKEEPIDVSLEVIDNGEYIPGATTDEREKLAQETDARHQQRLNQIQERRKAEARHE